MASRVPDSARLCDPHADLAIITSERIGDALISMVTASNLHRAGRRVTVYSRPIHELEEWFPGMRILPPPGEATSRADLAEHDVLVHTFDSDVRPGTESHPGILILDRLPEYRRPLVTQARVHQELVVSLFGIGHADLDNGMRRPGSAEAPDPSRVMIHPTANDPIKTWAAGSFLAVAEGLASRGFSPEFVTAPSEVGGTSWIESAGFRRFTASRLHDVALRLAGSRGHVGNDSGIAHLASSVGLPWVTVNVRRKLSIRWRPAWSEGESLLPSVPLLINPLKTRLWRRFITPKQVLAAFDRLMARQPG